MLETINEVLSNIDGIVWGVPLMVLILSGGLYLTIRMGFLQTRKLPLALKWMVKNEEDGHGEVTSFGALCTALSAWPGFGASAFWLTSSAQRCAGRALLRAQGAKGASLSFCCITRRMTPAL